MDTEMEDALSKLIDFIRDHGKIRVETGNIKNEVDKMKQTQAKIDEKFATAHKLEAKKEERAAKGKENTAKGTELRARIREGSAKADEIRAKEGEATQTSQEYMEILQKEWNKLRKEYEELKKECDEWLKEHDELLKEDNKWQKECNILRMECDEMEKEHNKVVNELDKKQCKLEKSVLEFKTLKIWQFDFIDDQIKSRLESCLPAIGSPDVSNILDDIRLLVFEQKERGRGNEMLSVHKLCKDPIVKIISTKKNIQKSFVERAKVLNLDKFDKKKSEKIRDNSKVLRLPGSLVETAILEVLNFPDSFPDIAKIFVKITDEVENPSSVDYQVVLKSEEKWERIPTELQEGYVRCPPRPRMKYLFVVSRGKWRQDTLTPEGLDWKAVDDKNVTVKYPPRSVSTKCEIRIQVMHPNPVEQAKSEEHQDDIDIESVSPCLWIKADNITKFQKPVTVTLPCPSSPSTTKKAELCLVEFADDDDIHISKRIVRVTPLFCEFEIDRPIRTAMVRFKHPITKTSKRWTREVKKHYPNLPKECIIVVFSATYVENTIWVEIVQSNRVEHLITLRSEQSMVQIKNARSKRLPLRYGEVIIVRAQTGIKIPQRYTGDYMQIKFTEKDDENNLTFGVDIMDKASSAELAFWLREKQVYVCRFNTDELPKGRRGTSNPDLRYEAQTQDPAFFSKYKTLCLQSISVLAHQIPVDKVVFLAIGLGLSVNDVEHLKAKGNTGLDLTLQVLIAWRAKCVHNFSEMINQLDEVLQGLNLNDIASTLTEASKVKRSLKTKDFAE